MKKLKLFLGVALFGAMTFGAFTVYDYVTMNTYEKAILDNIEALTGGETGGINPEHCYEKSSSGFATPRPQCKEGTTVSIIAPTYPLGTLYPCEANIDGGVFSKVGYCYKSVK